jgi:predicted Zn-dependent peptidase
MKKIIISVVCVMMSLQMQAQKFAWQNQKSAGYDYKTVSNDPSQARFYTLKNGLTVILSVNKEEPRIQTLIQTKAGSKSDPSTNTGLAHYLEHMLFKGTDKYGSLDWAKEKVYLDMIDDLYEQYNSTKDESKRNTIYKAIDSVSGIASKFAIANEYDKMLSMIGAKGTNAFTSFEQTCYVNEIPSNQVDAFLKIEAERFRNPVFRIFHTELEAVYEEKNRGLDNDGNKVFELLFSELFKNHNYGLQTTIGTIEHLKNPSLKEIRKYFYKYYVPNNMCVIMVGDLDPDATIKKIDEAFSYMQPKPIEPYTFTPEKEMTAPIEKSVYGPDAENVNIAFRFPGAATKDAMMLSFMSDILSNGNAGLLDLNLVKKQKVLDASAGSYALKDYSVLFFEGIAKEGQPLEEVKDLMLSQIELLKKGNFDDAILTAIINNYKKNLIQRNESNAGRAYTLLDAFTTEVDWLAKCQELELMSQLTKKDIVDFCNKWFKNNYVCIYKRIGKDEVAKVDKPQITPVTVNREAQSAFVKSIADMKPTPIQPVFVDYNTAIKQSKINNNVPLWTVKNNNNQLYTQYYHVQLGKAHNLLLPIALDYLQYLGTNKKSAEQVSKDFYTNACSFGISSSEEESYVYINGLQDNFAKDVALFEDLLQNCVADEDALKEMIAGIKKRRSDEKLNKGIIRSKMQAYAQYGAKNPSNNVLSNAALDNIKASQLIDLLKNITSYEHKVMYYGPSESNQIADVLTKLHKTPTVFKKAPEPTKYSFTTNTTNKVLFTNYDMVQSEIIWFRNNTNYDPTLVPSITLFNEYFGGNMSGIVFQEIRESKALAYSTYATFAQPQKKNEPFFTMAYVGCQADKMKESIAAMQHLLTELPESAKLLEQSKGAIKNSIATTRISKTGLFFNYINNTKKGINYDIRKNIYDQVGNLSFNDINSFFKNNISNKSYTLNVFGNKEKVNWDLMKNYGEVNTLSLEELFGY